MNSNSHDLSSYDNMYNFDFLMNNDASTFTGDSGMNLGFDAHHDWADGANAQLPDLFGGFFFGGPAGDGAAVDAGAGYPITGDFGDGHDAHSSATTSMWNGGQDGT